MEHKPLEWKAVYKNNSGRKRTLKCHEAVTNYTSGGLLFVIRVYGGFITVREWRLSIYLSKGVGNYRDGLPALVDGVRFWKLSDAKKWAEDFRGEGAKISAFSLSASYI